jgi:hypothetical protein|tara:strand:+ start:5228 stop:6937 length:1710 start_codon:yes stop_codon:yes gene_type:complete
MENENLDELLAQYEKAIRAALADGSDQAIEEASILDAEYEQLKARKASIEAAQTPSEIDDVIKSLPKAGAGAGAALDFVANILPYAQEVGIDGAIQLMKLLGMDGEKLKNNSKVMKDFARLFGPAGLLPNKENMPSIRQGISNLTGGATEYEPQTVPGEYAGTIMEFAGGAAALPIGGPVRSIVSSLIPGASSELAGQTARKYAPEYESLARFAAALGTPAVTAPVTQSISRRMTLGPADQIYGNVQGSQRAANVDLLKQMGMGNISAGQQIGSATLQKLEDVVEPTLTQKTDLTKMVLQRAGIEDGLATPNVIEKRAKELGKVFDDAEASVKEGFDITEGEKLLRLFDDANEMLSIGNIVGKTKKIIDEFSNSAVTGDAISYAQLKLARENLRKVMKSSLRSADDVNYDLANDVLEVIDDMIERNVLKYNPKLLPTLQKTRSDYRALLTAEKAVSGKGTDAASGIITPNALDTAIKNREGVTATTRLRGTDLAEISRAASEVLAPLPTVAAGSRRDVGGIAQAVRDFIPGYIARSQQDLLPMGSQDAITKIMQEQLLRSTGGLLTIPD